MTVKNGYPFIKESIDSIRDQTYKNWELIVVDDGSTDETIEYLKSIEHDDERFKFVYTTGVGRAKALNIAVSYAKGDLIANLDADDLSHPNRLQCQVEVFKSNSNIKFLCSRSIIFHEGDISFWPVCSTSFESVNRKILYTNPINHSSVMMVKNIFYDVGGYKESLDKIIDYDLWCRFFSHEIEMYRINSSLVAKRIHSRQSFENKRRFYYLYSSYKIRREFLRSVRAGYVYSILNFLKFIYGFIPQNIRMIVRKLKRNI
jgi:glycosyltransferase involved in cell wall biosynthesis